MAAASALAGPGDYWDLDQLPLIDPILRATGGEATAPKKRKRAISILEITDSEPEPALLAPELGDDTEDEEEPAPKRRNPTLSDYTPNARNILRVGKKVFRGKVLAKHAFPSRSTQALLASESWEESRLSLPVATAGKLFITRGFTTHALLSLWNCHIR